MTKKEAQMTIDNPLTQYFRRPAVHLRLPSNGIYYDKETIDIPESGEIPIYPMTAIDDITAKTPDALFNGSAVTELLKSCAPCIKDPWKINAIDLDAILIAIRAATRGNEMELSTVCPKCEKENTYGVNLISILSQLKPGDYATPFIHKDLQIKFKPLEYTVLTSIGLRQFEIQRQSLLSDNLSDAEKIDKSKTAILAIANLTYDVITNTIEHIQLPTGFVVTDKKHINDFLRNIDSLTFEKIRDYASTLRASTEIKPLDVECPECQHKFKQPFIVNTSDFFA